MGVKVFERSTEILLLKVCLFGLALVVVSLVIEMLMNLRVRVNNERQKESKKKQVIEVKHMKFKEEMLEAGIENLCSICCEIIRQN